MNRIRNHKRYDPEVKLSYQEAVDRGISTYWTGDPCVNGHSAHRYVCNKKCVICEYERGRNQRGKVIKDEAKSAGINPDIRRKIEEMRIAKEYSIDL